MSGDALSVKNKELVYCVFLFHSRFKGVNEPLGAKSPPSNHGIYFPTESLFSEVHSSYPILELLNFGYSEDSDYL